MKPTEIYKALSTNLYFILLDDTGRTFNLNMYTFETLATSQDEAIGKMIRIRPDLKPKDIVKITKY